MAPKLSHVLIGGVGVGVAVVVFVIAQGVADTARALQGGGRPVAAKVEKAAPEPEPKEADPKAGHKGERNVAKEHPEPRDPREEPRPERGDEDRDGGGRMVQRAEALGVDVQELRAAKAAEKGMTLEQYKNKRQARQDWRQKQDPDELAERRDLRQERKALADDMAAQAAAMRDLGQVDPSLKDAASVLRQLDRLGGEDLPPGDEEWVDEEGDEAW